MICGARRVAEQGGRTLRLLICGAGRVAEQGGRTVRLLICGARRVAEQGGRTVRLLICGAGRVAEQGGRTLRLLIVVQEGWRNRVAGHYGYWLWCRKGGGTGWQDSKATDLWCTKRGWEEWAVSRLVICGIWGVAEGGRRVSRRRARRVVEGWGGVKASDWWCTKGDWEDGTSPSTTFDISHF